MFYTNYPFSWYSLFPAVLIPLIKLGSYYKKKMAITNDILDTVSPETHIDLTVERSEIIFLLPEWIENLIALATSLILGAKMKFVFKQMS